MRAALRLITNDSRLAERALANINRAANRITPNGLERMSRALRAMQASASSTLSTLGKISRVSIRGGMALGSGAVAGGYLMQRVAERPMTYDRNLALLSNTANNNLDATGRIAAKDKMTAGIRNAVNIGGGSPEQAATALNAMAASNAFGSMDNMLKLLPMVQKAATGSGADSIELVQILRAAKQNLGVADKDLPAVLAKAMKGGQEGLFELSAMAKHLPEQMAKAGQLGYKGLPGLEKLVTQNQMSAITSGTQDSAGINMINLLNKINSRDTAKDFEKQGIDLTGSLAKNRMKGINAVDTFVSLVERVASKDKKYVALRKKADAQTGSELQETLSAVADILEQKGIGITVQDSQAMSGLLGQMQNKNESKRVNAAIEAEKGKEIDTSFDVVANSIDFKSEQVGNKKAFAAIDTLTAINEPLSRLLDKTNELAEANPKLTERVYEGATALTVLAASAGAAGLANTAMAGSAAGFSAALMTAGGALVSLAALGAAGVAGYTAGTKLHDNLSPSVNDAIGGAVNWFLEVMGSEQAAENTKMINAYKASQRREKEWPKQINLHIDGHQVATVVNQQNTKQSRRN